MAQLTSARISIDNEDIENFVNIEIIQDVYGMSSFRISYELESLEKYNDFIVDRSKNFIGKTCTIKSEFKEVGSSGTKEGFSFRGIVTELFSTRSGMRSGDIIIIHGKSPDIILKGKANCRTFKDMTLEQIVNEVLQPYPRNLLKPNVSPAKSDQLSYVVQYKESDYDFLRRISSRYGEWFFYSGQELFFGELPDQKEADLTIGKDLDNFQFVMRSGPSASKLKYVHDSQKETLSWESGRNNVDQQLNEYGRHVYSESNLLFTEQSTRMFNHLNVPPDQYESALKESGNMEETADALKLTQTMGTGNNMSLKIGQEIVVSNPGKKDSAKSFGRYRITSLKHSCDQVLNYDNNFRAMTGESKIPENTNPCAIPRSSPIRGHVIDNLDPEKLGRVMVDYGWESGPAESTPWIRVITPYVMKKGGNFFVPEIDTDVLVAFEDDNMERPYVMGAFNTGPDNFCPDPEWGNETPKIKAIRTQSGHTIEFHDTDGGEKIRIYDKEEKNEITFDTANNELKIFATEKLKIEAKEIEITADQGISIAAGQHMSIEAGQNLNAEAGQNLALKGQGVSTEAQSDLSISALNVDISANAQFKAAGSAGSEVSSSAILILKGSLVNIN